MPSRPSDRHYQDQINARDKRILALEKQVADLRARLMEVTR